MKWFILIIYFLDQTLHLNAPLNVLLGASVKVEIFFFDSNIQ